MQLPTTTKNANASSKLSPFLPCLILRSALLPRRKLIATFIICTLVLLLVRRQRLQSAEAANRLHAELLKHESKAKQTQLYGSVNENTGCRYPSFVLHGQQGLVGNYLEEEDDENDATARARVGPNPQLHPDANYTVIYNYASPKPKRTKLALEEESAAYNENGTYVDEDDRKGGLPAAAAPQLDDGHVTLVTHATPEFLYPDLVSLLGHWRDEDGDIDLSEEEEDEDGKASLFSRHLPLSVAVYAPGEDFCLAAATISWLWNCEPRVKEQVSFHVFFPSDFANEVALKTASDGIRILDVNCAVRPDFAKEGTYRAKKKLPYPVNTARNVARTAANTKFVLTSDIELHPSARLSKNFIEFTRTEAAKKLLEDKSRPVAFVVPTFEIEKDAKFEFPANKRQLVELYGLEQVVYFHKYSCKHCQLFPGLKRWTEPKKGQETGGEGDTEPDQKVEVFTTASRHTPFHRWEPIYIGNQDDPLYDERLSWEGFQDKMSQMHELCLRNYRLAILDTAFLVHKPGVKHKKTKKPEAKDEAWRTPFVKKNAAAYKDIMKEFRAKYGENKKCKENLKY